MDDRSVPDPQLQDAVEALLWQIGERTRCPLCYKLKSRGHTRNCRIGKLNAILNERVPRSSPSASPESGK